LLRLGTNAAIPHLPELLVVAGLSHVGTIAPGRRADLVVASEDPFLLPAKALAQVSSDLVLLAGQVVAAAGHLV
jgi:predicted amidohydrolase YtcJ